MAGVGETKKSKVQDSEKDSKKIWVTLTTKYTEILDILADDTPGKIRSNRKSILIEKMVDEFLEKHEKELNDDGKWAKIISVRKRAANKLEKSIDEKIIFINTYIGNYPELAKLEKLWSRIKIIKDIDGIDKIYKKVDEKRQQDMQQLDSLLDKI